MKINISGLMSMISEYDKQINALSFKIKNEVYSVSIQELNGTVNVIDENKEDFTRNMTELEDKIFKLTQLKTILYKKNNSFHLSDGRTIQSAIVDNSNLSFLENNYDYILNFRSTKTRCTEVNNSYFECKNINFDTEEIRKKLEDIKDKIQQTDLEISKLNSQIFEINI